MTCWEIRSLIEGKKKKVKLSEETIIFIKAFEEKAQGITLSKEDYFYAGYILSNPIVRENLVKNYKQKLEIEQKRETK